jgi:hypothetical protein
MKQLIDNWKVINILLIHLLSYSIDSFLSYRYDETWKCHCRRFLAWPIQRNRWEDEIKNWILINFFEIKFLSCMFDEKHGIKAFLSTTIMVTITLWLCLRAKENNVGHHMAHKYVVFSWQEWRGKKKRIFTSLACSDSSFMHTCRSLLIYNSCSLFGLKTFYFFCI